MQSCHMHCTVCSNATIIGNWRRQCIIIPNVHSQKNSHSNASFNGSMNGVAGVDSSAPAWQQQQCLHVHPGFGLTAATVCASHAVWPGSSNSVYMCIQASCSLAWQQQQCLHVHPGFMQFGLAAATVFTCASRLHAVWPGSSNSVYMCIQASACNSVYMCIQASCSLAWQQQQCLHVHPGFMQFGLAAATVFTCASRLHAVWPGSSNSVYMCIQASAWQQQQCLHVHPGFMAAATVFTCASRLRPATVFTCASRLRPATVFTCASRLRPATVFTCASRLRPATVFTCASRLRPATVFTCASCSF